MPTHSSHLIHTLCVGLMSVAWSIVWSFTSLSSMDEVDAYIQSIACSFITWMWLAVRMSVDAPHLDEPTMCRTMLGTACVVFGLSWIMYAQTTPAHVMVVAMLMLVSLTPATTSILRELREDPTSPPLQKPLLDDVEKAASPEEEKKKEDESVWEVIPLLCAWGCTYMQWYDPALCFMYVTAYMAICNETWRAVVTVASFVVVGTLGGHMSVLAMMCVSALDDVMFRISYK